MVKLLTHIQESDDINCNYDSAFIGSDILFPTNNQPYHVIRLSKEGEVVDRYYPKETQKKGLGVDVYDNNIYMLQCNRLTVITHREENNITYNIYRNNMSAVLVKDKTTVFVSQEQLSEAIFKYDTVNRTTETMVEGLNKPTFMSRSTHQKDTGI